MPNRCCWCCWRDGTRAAPGLRERGESDRRRTLNRDRELSLRTALGASRRQLVGQLLTESVLLGVAGGVVGLVVLARRSARSRPSSADSRRVRRHRDRRPRAAVRRLVSLLTGVAFGALPGAGHPAGCRSGVETGRGSGSSSPAAPAQQVLVVSQVAVSVVLLTGAGLLLTSFYRLQKVNAGYKAERVLSAEVYGTSRATGPRKTRSPLSAAARATEGLPACNLRPSAVSSRSARHLARSPALQIEGRAAAGRGRPATDTAIASDDYFRTLGIPIIGGREIRATDTRESTP